MKAVIAVVSFLPIPICTSSCGTAGSPSAVGHDYSYRVPVRRPDGWDVGNLDTGGLDARRLEDMMAYIHQRGDDSFLRNVLIVKNGRLVFEEYFPSSGIDELSHLQSATKSVVSAMFGIAVSNGYVASIDDPLFAYFPEYEDLDSPEKEAITVEDVLTMTPGFDWNEHSSPTFGAQNDNIAAYASNNYIRYVLQKDVVTTPGTSWNYNSGCPMLLAGIIKNEVGAHLDEYGEEQLFRPLGIRHFRWEHQADGLPLATGGLWLRARDEAKIGQVYLDDGRWQGEQIVPSEWVGASLTAHAQINSTQDYGYLWWTDQRVGYRLWYAAGYGGQLIILVPAADAVIVVNADYSSDTDVNSQRTAAIWGLITTFVLPAT